MSRKAGIISLGCPKNLVDSELMLGILKDRGYTVSETIEGADIAIVNTCGFIQPATEESVDTVLRLIGLKKRKKIRTLVVTGCLVEKYRKQDLLRTFPEVDAFLGTGDVGKIYDVARKTALSPQVFVSSPEKGFLEKRDTRRHILTPPHYVYVKIAEGCRNRCSYCLIPRLRGDFRSRTMESVIAEIKGLCRDARISELDIVAHDTTFYGRDIYGRSMLSPLLKRIARLKAARWVRFLYSHPAHFTDDLIGLINDEPSVCKYIDLPLQHINDGILSRMGRKVTKKEIMNLIHKLRKRIPGVVLRSSFIVGFPGEAEKEFKELLAFLRESRFERLGAFIYSREEGTRAHGFARQVSEKAKKERFCEIMKTQQEISRERNRKFVGRETEVLVDGIDEKRGVLLCRTEGDAPEIDGYVFVMGRKAKAGEFIKVRITGSDAYDLFSDFELKKKGEEDETEGREVFGESRH